MVKGGDMKRLAAIVLIAWLVALAAMSDNLVSSPTWLGDYVEDETVYFQWHSTNSAGASVTRTTDGTISIYKDNGATESTAGVTDTEDFDALTGIHACAIDTSADAFYVVGSDYTVVLSAATIDSQPVNAELAHFSLQNTFNEVDVTFWRGTAVPAEHTAGYPIVTVKDGTGTGEINSTSSGWVRQMAWDSLLIPAVAGTYTADAATKATITDYGIFSITEDSYSGYWLIPVDGNNAGIPRRVARWDGTEGIKTWTVSPEWQFTQGAGVTYDMAYGNKGVSREVAHVGVAQAGAASQITLAADASSTTDHYKYGTVYVTGGTGAGQKRVVLTYDGSTKVAIVDRDWKTNPDSTSVYEVKGGVRR